MEFNGRVHPGCVNSSNPYHVCGAKCLEKIAGRDGKKGRGKQAPIRRSTAGDKPIKYGGERNVNPKCPKASNPYHECNGRCLKEVGADPNGVRTHRAASRSPRKMKPPEGEPKADKLQVPGTAANAPQAAGEKVEIGYGESFSSKYSKGPCLEDLINKDRVNENSDAIYAHKGNKPNHDKDEVQVKVGANEIQEELPDAIDNSQSLSFSGITRPRGDDDAEVKSVISDSCVAVGNYHVRASVSSTLQSIIDKHGDVAVACELRSVSMLAYYLECLCFVVQELKSTSFENLTKPKLEEMQDIVIDLESVKIEVKWLHDLLKELQEAVEFRDQPKSEAESYGQDLESTKNELENQIKELQRQEQELEELKAQVAERRARIEEKELERSRLTDQTESIRSKIEKLSGKSVLEGL